MPVGYAIHQRRVPIIVEQPGLDAGMCWASGSPWLGSTNMSCRRTAPGPGQRSRRGRIPTARVACRCRPTTPDCPATVQQRGLVAAPWRPRPRQASAAPNSATVRTCLLALPSSLVPPGQPVRVDDTGLASSGPRATSRGHWRTPSSSLAPADSSLSGARRTGHLLTGPAAVDPRSLVTSVTRGQWRPMSWMPPCRHNPDREARRTLGGHVRVDPRRR